MDVMRPQLVWINGAAYRLNTPIASNSLPTDYHNYNEEEQVVDDYSADIHGSSHVPDDHTGEDPSIYGSSVERLGPGRFSGRLNIPSALFGSLIGRGGRSLRQVEQRSRCRVRVPRGSGARSPVRISGESATDVQCACAILSSIAERARRAIAPSHFVGVKLAGADELIQRFSFFCRQVTCEAAGDVAGVSCYSHQLLQLPERLHVTFSVLTLLNAAERSCVIERLQQHRLLLPPASSASAVDDRTSSAIQLRVCGVDVMNDDPAEARVLYARVFDSENRLQALADSIVAELNQLAGGSQRSNPASVKLHCTLMNTSFVLRDCDESGGDCAPSVARTFDARPLLEQWGDYDFGKVTIDAVHLLQRHSFTDDGFYTSIAHFSIAS